MKLKTFLFLGARFFECKFFGKRYPLAIALELTHKCNLACRHCYNTNLESKLGREDHLRLLDEIYEENCRIISFTGGEPLLIPYLPELMVKAKKLGMWVQYTTNGLLLPKLENEIKKADPDMIQLSVDGDEYAHEKVRGEKSFEQAAKALEVVKKNNWRCLLVSVLHKYTSIESLTFVLTKALDTGAFVSFHPLCDYPELEPSPEDMAILLNFLKEMRRVRNIKGFINVLEKYNTRHIFEEVYTGTRAFYNPMEQSMVVLDFLSKDSGNKFVPCTGGRLFGRIMPDGQLISCYDAMDPAHPVSVLKDGFKTAWKNIRLHKGREVHHHRLELNLIYALSISTLISVCYYHLSKRYYKRILRKKVTQ